MKLLYRHQFFFSLQELLLNAFLAIQVFYEIHSSYILRGLKLSVLILLLNFALSLFGLFHLSKLTRRKKFSLADFAFLLFYFSPLCVFIAAIHHHSLLYCYLSLALLFLTSLCCLLNLLREIVLFYREQ